MERKKKNGRLIVSKIIVVMLMLVLMLSMLPSCSNPNGETVTDPTADPTKSPTTEPAQGEELDESVMEGNTYLTGLPIVKEKETITVAVARHSNDATESYEEKHFVIKAEEDTNIHIEWMEYSTNIEEQLSVLLAGDMPDVFLGLLTDSHISQNPSLFLPLNDLIEEKCPNVYAYYQENVDGWREFLTYPDGNIYSMMGSYYKSYNNLINGLQFINMEWLNNVGKSMPTTLAEYKDVLMAFRDQDANGNGDPKDEIPIDFCQNHYAAHIMDYATMWGIPYYYAIKDGVVTETINTNAYREFLEYFHELGQEGLLNVEGFSQTEEQYSSHLDSMSVGAFHGWAPYTYINDFEKQQKYAVLPPIAADGYEPVIHVNSRTQASRNNFVITKDCENPTAALRWWDYLSSTQEMAMFVNRGEEGIIYELGDDGKYYAHTPTAEDLKEFGYDKYVSNIGTSSFAASLGTVNNHPLVYNSISADIVKDPTNTTSIRTIAMNEYAPYFEKEIMSQAIIPSSKLEEYTFSTEGLLDYINSFTASSIIDGVTDASWDEYVKQLGVYNYPYYISWNQDYYDGKFVE